MACKSRETTCCGTLVPNQAQTAYCPDGTVGDSVTIPAGTYHEGTQEEANAIALAAAEAQLHCCDLFNQPDEFDTWLEGAPVIVA